jgi:hypothetical protein
MVNSGHKMTKIFKIVAFLRWKKGGKRVEKCPTLISIYYKSDENVIAEV